MTSCRSQFSNLLPPNSKATTQRWYFQGRGGGVGGVCVCVWARACRLALPALVSLRQHYCGEMASWLSHLEGENNHSNRRQVVNVSSPTARHNAPVSGGGGVEGRVGGGGVRGLWDYSGEAVSEWKPLNTCLSSCPV